MITYTMTPALRATLSELYRAEATDSYWPAAYVQTCFDKLAAVADGDHTCTIEDFGEIELDTALAPVDFVALGLDFFDIEPV